MPGVINGILGEPTIAKHCMGENHLLPFLMKELEANQERVYFIICI